MLSAQGHYLEKEGQARDLTETLRDRGLLKIYSLQIMSEQSL